MEYDNFFSICPRTITYLGETVESIPLRVIQDKDIVVSPDININVSDLANGYKHFYNGGSKADTFKISVIIHKDDIVTHLDGDRNLHLTTALDSIVRKMIPVMVYTNAIDIKDQSMWIITNNSSRTQAYKDYTVWELEFTSYTAINIAKYETNNSAVQKAIATNKKKNSASASKNSKNSKTTKKVSTNKSRLKKCNYKNLKYSAKQKKVTCVIYLQKVLKNQKLYNRQADGWFGKYTKQAVKDFQKKYNKKHKTKNKKTTKKLKVTGKIDKATFNALCE